MAHSPSMVFLLLLVASGCAMPDGGDHTTSRIDAAMTRSTDLDLGDGVAEDVERDDSTTTDTGPDATKTSGDAHDAEQLGSLDGDKCLDQPKNDPLCKQKCHDEGSTYCVGSTGMCKCGGISGCEAADYLPCHGEPCVNGTCNAAH